MNEKSGSLPVGSSLENQTRISRIGMNFSFLFVKIRDICGKKPPSALKRETTQIGDINFNLMKT